MSALTAELLIRDIFEYPTKETFLNDLEQLDPEDLYAARFTLALMLARRPEANEDKVFIDRWFIYSVADFVRSVAFGEPQRADIINFVDLVHTLMEKLDMDTFDFPLKECWHCLPHQTLHLPPTPG